MSENVDTGTLLEAGAILAPGAHAGEDADELTARRYSHSALGERPIVRLTPGTLGEAEDLALGFLGLRREDVTGHLGQVRRETLGFPAWALVNDPANGHHALALVQDVERLGRMAKSRAGAAKDGFEELGTRLGRSVPHFLPTFYEQAARAFLAHENTTYAATFFGKAREAERVHSLDIDEDRQRAVFLEFAFAGALTVKALKEHVRDLAQRLDPAAAWEQFRQLVVERCAAGMAPYAALPQDARKFIRAAKLDVAAEESALLADLLPSPAVVRAPGTFWKAYLPALVALAQQQPEVRRRLLEIMPAGLGYDSGSEDAWLEMLAETGTEELLTGAPREGLAPAEWLADWSAFLKSGYGGRWRSPRTYALVERMAERLRADGVPVDLYRGSGWRQRMDLDLLDVLLTHEVPVADPPADRDQLLELDQWFGGIDAGRRDLAAVAADPRFRPLLKAAAGGDTQRYGNVRNAHVYAIARHPVLRGVLAEWLGERSAELGRAQGLPGARSVTDRLMRFRSVNEEVNPGAVARVREYEAGRALGRTLRSGIFDEVGWPALEEAMRLLGPRAEGRRNDWFAMEEAWPALIVARRHKAVVAGPEGILLDHDLRLPAGLDEWRQPSFRYADGELLVSWWDSGKQLGYWSSRPGEVFTLDGRIATYWRSATVHASLPLPGGGRTTGGRPLHAGDTKVPEASCVSGDGSTYWRLRSTSAGHQWIEYDPVTGAAGRASLPPLLAGAVREGSRLRAEHSQVLPMQPGLEGSLLGTDGSVLGRWVRADGDRMTAGSPDGTTVSVPARSSVVPLGALRLPGGTAPVLAVDGNRLRLYADGAAPADGALCKEENHTSGTPLVPAAVYWHAMRVRDEAGSLALRDVSDAQAAELLAGMTAVVLRAREEKWDSARRSEAEQDLIARLLPAVTHPGLRRGVAGVVHSAFQLAEAVDRCTTPEQPRGGGKKPVGDTEMFADHQPEHGDDLTVQSACRALLGIGFGGSWGSSAWTVLRQIRAANQVLAGQPASGRPVPTAHDLTTLSGGWASDPFTAPNGFSDWTPLLDHLPAVAYRATAPGVDEDERSALLLLLEHLAEGPLAERRGELRRIVLRENDRRKTRVGQVLRHGERTVVVLASLRMNASEDQIEWVALDLDPSGAFGPVAHFAITESRTLGSYPAARLKETAALVREHGAAAWRSEAAAALAAVPGCGPAQAALLVAGRAGVHNAYATALVELLGLKRTEVQHGHDRLEALDREDRLRVLAALLPREPAALWDDGPAVEAATAVWTARFGHLVRLPEGLDVSLNGVATPEAAEAVLNPAHTPWISRTTTQGIDENGRLTAQDPSAVPTRHVFAPAVRALGQLAYELPPGHPLRAALPAGLDAVRRRLADPRLLLDLDLEFTESGSSTARELRKAYGLPEAGGAGPDGLTRVGDAFVLVPWYQDMEATVLRPAGLSGADAPELGLIEGLLGSRGTWALQALRGVLGGGLERAVAVRAGEGWPQDAARSVPELVAEVAKECGLSEDAAVLYLQILALPDPTDRNCAKWTGWKPARLKKARAELAATDLVVEAKRARAGRGLFLPGGWEALKAPALPVESWKRGHLPVHSHLRVVPMAPVAELFEAAWQRVRDGDVPAFEELTTRATRKGRRR
ncbi:hypothetical protein AB0M28_22145 [Streptomyces sp. NPDC051940]|uniref:hypothetical protein n=1 Tax=Streptomyces sp. NPDC051940 TaxID=3155675 RepID=UPI00344059A7